MKQYCRYCGYCFDGDAPYCTAKEKVLSESELKRQNRCKDFWLRHTDREAVQAETPERNRANQNGGNRMTHKIFRKVHCKAYLQKFSDGVHLECFEITPESGAAIPTTLSRWSADTKINVTACRWEEEIKDLSAFEGEYVVKQYRRRVEDEFEGFLVGITQIATSAQIGTDYYDDTYREYQHLFKIAETERVGVVYFKNNVKRYVPLEDIKYMEGIFGTRRKDGRR